MCAHVLVAEDDKRQADVIRRYLEHEGHTTTVVHDGGAALEEVRRGRPDLLVLDVMMPVIDGLGVCRIVRRESDVAVLMLTARTTEEDLLLGLELGADDYLTKPYSPRELMARIRTLLRRARPAPVPVDDPVRRIGDLAVDPERHTVHIGGRQVACTPGEFEILAALADAPDRVFSRHQLLTQTRGSAGYISERTVDMHILNLRKKMERDPARPAYLLTVFGVGYKLADGSTAPLNGTHRRAR